MLEELSNGIWTQVEPLSMMGIQFGNRTTVIKLDDNNLLLHSPGRLTEKFKNNLDELGKVKYIVAPNYYHSLFFEKYVEAYSEVEIFMAPKLEKKRSDIPCSGVLGSIPLIHWSAELEQHLVEGLPAFNEVVFCHKPSKTLILTDLAVNMLNPKGIMTNIHFFVHGANRRFAFSRIVKMMIKDKNAFSKSLQLIMNWDFDRILVSHGEIIASDGKKTMENTFSSYL